MLYKKIFECARIGLIYGEKRAIIVQMDKLCFVSVEFPDDENVVGRTYWYLCKFEGAEEGDRVQAPLGRHNRIQCGVIRAVIYAEMENSPYPWYLIKDIAKLIKE